MPLRGMLWCRPNTCRKMCRSMLPLVAFAVLAGQTSARSWGRSLYNESSANHTCLLREFMAEMCYSDSRSANLTITRGAASVMFCRGTSKPRRLVLY